MVVIVIVCQTKCDKVMMIGITGVVCGICSWKVERSDDFPGAQVDLILDRDDNEIDLCEMKFTRERFLVTAEYHEKLPINQREFV